ncbi:MAG: hypothetical protein ACYC6C_14395, partial [Coriobacteriia bacterium]
MWWIIVISIILLLIIFFGQICFFIWSKFGKNKGIDIGENGYIYLSDNFPFWGNGLTADRDYVFIKRVYYMDKGKPTNIESLADRYSIIRHEETHRNYIIRKGTLSYKLTMIFAYAQFWRKHNDLQL